MNALWKRHYTKPEKSWTQMFTFLAFTPSTTHLMVFDMYEVTLCGTQQLYSQYGRINGPLCTFEHSGIQVWTYLDQTRNQAGDVKRYSCRRCHMQLSTMLASGSVVKYKYST